MSFIRSFLLIGLISLFASGVFLYLGKTLFDNSIIGNDELGGGYAVLSTESSVDDRTLFSLLDLQFLQSVPNEIPQTGGIRQSPDSPFDGTPVSESSLWVWLDNFDSLEAIPLDNYFSRVHSFDPRYDEFAEKLRDIFVRDGKRFVYIPIKAGNWNSALLDKHFDSLLGGISYTVEYFGMGKPLSLFFIMYIAAAGCFFIICFFNKKSFNGAFLIIAVIPVLSSLAFFGAGGIGFAALFIAFFILFKEPLSEFITLITSASNKKNQKKIDIMNQENVNTSNKKTGKSFLKLVFKEIFIPYKNYIFVLPVFIAVFFMIFTFSQVNNIFLLAVFLTAFAVFLISIKIFSNISASRQRFTPVLIIKRRSVDFNFSVYTLPFAAAALIALFLAPYQSGQDSPNNRIDFSIDEQDYYNHLANQASFSFRPLEILTGQTASPRTGAKPGFFFADDGLPSMSIAALNQTIDLSEYMPFPSSLKNMMDFFSDSGQKTNAPVKPFAGFFTQILSLSVLLFLCILGVLIKIRNDYMLKADFSGFKRFVQNIRLRGINWSKSALYNGRNKHLRKAGANKKSTGFLAGWKVLKDA